MRFTGLLRCLVAVLGLAGVSAWAQLLNEAWTGYALDGNSTYSLPQFIKSNRTIAVRSSWNSNVRSIVCFDDHGIQQWSYALPTGTYPTVIRTTSDNYIYICLPGAISVIALDQDGGYRWQVNQPQFGYGTFSDSRVFGNDLLMVGIGRSLPLASNQRTILVSVNRFTGAVNYSLEKNINGALYTDSPALKSAAGKAFLIMRRNSGSGILKVDPATGGDLASYAAGPVYTLSAEVDSTSQVYLTGYINPAINTDRELRRIDGSGSGTMTMVYRRLTTARDFILSKGALIATGDDGLRKIRSSDGALLWERLSVPIFNGVVRADQYGRLYSSRWVGGVFTITLTNPDTGADIESIQTSMDGYDTLIQAWSLNSFGEVINVGDVDDTSLYREGYRMLVFSTPEPVDDFYDVVQGTTFATNGNGVLANDRYSNPAACFVTKAPNSGPASGNLFMGVQGEFSFEAKSGGVQLPFGTQTFRYRTSRQGVTREGSVTLNIVRGITALTVSRPEIAGFSMVSGSVTISSAGAAAVISLEDDSPSLSTPASVTVPANKTSASFIMSSTEVFADTPVTITARLGVSTRTVSLNLAPLRVAAFSCTYSVQGGDPFDFEVILNGRPGPGGFVVTLSESNQYVTVPPTITVPEGLTSAVGSGTTTSPPTNQIVYITATGGGESDNDRLIVLRPQ